MITYAVFFVVVIFHTHVATQAGSSTPLVANEYRTGNHLHKILKPSEAFSGPPSTEGFTKLQKLKASELIEGWWGGSLKPS